MIARLDSLRARGQRFIGNLGQRAAPAMNGWLPGALKDWFEADEHPGTADIVKGTVAGLAGGLVGSWAMN